GAHPRAARHRADRRDRRRRRVRVHAGVPRRPQRGVGAARARDRRGGAQRRGGAAAGERRPPDEHRRRRRRRGGHVRAAQQRPRDHAAHLAQRQPLPADGRRLVGVRQRRRDGRDGGAHHAPHESRAHVVAPADHLPRRAHLERRDAHRRLVRDQRQRRRPAGVGGVQPARPRQAGDRRQRLVQHHDLGQQGVAVGRGAEDPRGLRGRRHEHVLQVRHRLRLEHAPGERRHHAPPGVEQPARAAPPAGARRRPVQDRHAGRARDQLGRADGRRAAPPVLHVLPAHLRRGQPQAHRRPRAGDPPRERQPGGAGRVRVLRPGDRPRLPQDGGHRGPLQRRRDGGQRAPRPERGARRRRDLVLVVRDRARAQRLRHAPSRGAPRLGAGVL
ncbi:MAG: hypothetical protein AVDCRST_MAG11-4, partial [uncultured Gemmatimonadaceae bacterium]